MQAGTGRELKPVSFVHVADTHLGYRQYGLAERWDDFSLAFKEVVDKTIGLKPDFMIISGDVFHDPRPTNRTLEVAVRNLMRLRDERINVFVVGGSHDSSPNVTTGTILKPLDRGKLIYYLPAHEGASYRGEGYYIYGIPNFRTRREVERGLSSFYEQNPPKPDPAVFNICVMHMALDHPEVLSTLDISKEYVFDLSTLPSGFDYYAGGHLHKPVITKLHGEFRGATLAYSGCVETASIRDAEYDKGFFHVSVDGSARVDIKRTQVERARPFDIVEVDGTGKKATEIMRLAREAVRSRDGDGKVIALILRGTLPTDVRKVEINSAEIKSAAKRALHARVSNQMFETRMTEEMKRKIIEYKPEDLMKRAYRYMVGALRETEGKEAERIATIATKLVDPLKRRDERQVLELLEKL